MKLLKKNAIVTGGSMGLGAAIVKEFIQEGANVVFCSRNEREGNKLLVALKKFLHPGQELIYQKCDVSSKTEINQLFTLVFKKLKTIHILVNNAGIYGPMGPSEDVLWEEWTEAIEINLFGVFAFSRKVIPIFKKQKYGKIINISGGGATNPLPGISAYAASKAAVVRLTETLAEELQDWNVDVNAVAPGVLNTRLLDQVLKAGPDKVGQTFYQKSMKQSSDGGTSLEKGAQLCVYLASRESDGISGKLISALWDPWPKLKDHQKKLKESDIYCLRRIVPEDRGMKF